MVQQYRTLARRNSVIILPGWDSQESKKIVNRYCGGVERSLVQQEIQPGAGVPVYFLVIVCGVL